MKLALLLAAALVLAGGWLTPDPARCYDCPLGRSCVGDMQCDPMMCALHCVPKTMLEKWCR